MVIDSGVLVPFTIWQGTKVPQDVTVDRSVYDVAVIHYVVVDDDPSYHTHWLVPARHTDGRAAQIEYRANNSTYSGGASVISSDGQSFTLRSSNFYSFCSKIVGYRLP